MRIVGFKFGFVLVVACVAMALVACSDKKVSGIEIGNPSLAFTADFSVDYSQVSGNSLAKAASDNEPLLLDSFALDFFQVRSYSSYYVAVNIDMTSGVQLWPDEDIMDSSLRVSFTDASVVEEPFKGIDLEDVGYLKEMGVLLRPHDDKDYMAGRLLVKGKYVPFRYSLSWFKNFELRYHFSQIERVSDSLANLSVVFYPRYFADGVDFSQVAVAEDGVVYLDELRNADIWAELNQQFIPSFRSLRYGFSNSQGELGEAYVLDIWEGIIGSMSDNTISNGDFSKGFENWILFNQFEGEYKASVEKESSGEHYAKIQVTKGGSKSYSVQLIQENVALLAGKKYKCVFTIWSDIEGQITARIGAYDDYMTVGFQEHVQVGTSGKSVEIEFTPRESTPFARFELNLGKMERTFYIKAVKIYRIQK